MRRFIFLTFANLIFLSCQHDIHNYTEIDAPAEIAARAFSFAELYEQSETEWFIGGQDPARRVIKIDCSGIVIMCYKYALVDTKYELLESDMTADYMHKNATSIINKNELRKGDLIFMGEEESNSVTHIALYEKTENKMIYFIDSTQKDTDGDGVYDINGVTRRKYPENDKKFKSFGIMRLQY